MKHKIQKVELFIGVIIFLGGLLTYGLGVHQLLPVPRPDLVVYGTTLIGIILIFMGCDIFSKPTKEMQILENDERNIAITNASLANAYKVTLTLLVLVLFALVFMGYMSKVVFFSIAGVIAIGQITWVITARYSVLKKSFYGCSNYPECKFTLAEHFRKKKLTKTNVKELLEGKETLVKGIKNKEKKPYNAVVKIGEKGYIDFISFSK